MLPMTNYAEDVDGSGPARSLKALRASPTANTGCASQVPVKSIAAAAPHTATRMAAGTIAPMIHKRAVAASRRSVLRK